MGKNGSGKSTFAKVLVGHRDYEVNGGSVVFKFYGYIMPKLEMVNIKADFLNRNVKKGFSGGEKKRNEILQIVVLGAKLAILDEIDSGLDVDALRDVSKPLAYTFLLLDFGILLFWMLL
ncbi:abc transporter i family member 6, chloroplastic [Artemisia annua]|uniref:Abc transporter i family member 6, chloroplastic n=1 Tax=Artemisia annua TaxID=35608 RepID=A0A2U1M567_ARTAN|nr:abc transporter i family member 6, chloroplastic [Artemisia annua]